MSELNSLSAVVFRHRNMLRKHDVEALRRRPAVQLSTEKLRDALVLMAVAAQQRTDGGVSILVRGSIPLKRRVVYAGFEMDPTGSYRDLVEGPVWEELSRRLEDEAPLE